MAPAPTYICPSIPFWSSGNIGWCWTGIVANRPRLLVDGDPPQLAAESLDTVWPILRLSVMDPEEAELRSDGTCKDTGGARASRPKGRWTFLRRI